MSGLPVTVKEVILYSHSYTGQNRNQTEQLFFGDFDGLKALA